MDAARFVEQGLPEERVPAEACKPHHKGFLRCPFCEVAVVHSSGSPSRDGDNGNGTRPHYRLSPPKKGHPKNAHEEGCPVPDFMYEHGRTTYDLELGFRFHIRFVKNAGTTRLFNRCALYKYNEYGELVPADEETGRMQPVSIKDAKRMASLLSGQSARVPESLVINRQSVLPMDSFLFADAGDAEVNSRRLGALCRHLNAGANPPVFMPVRPRGRWSPVVKHDEKYGPHIRIPCQPVALASGHALAPTVIVEHPDQLANIRKAGDHLALIGRVFRGRTYQDDGRPHTSLHVRVSGAEWLTHIAPSVIERHIA